MRHVVGISEMKFSTTPGDVVVTHALGSCVGIAIHDPVNHVGGIFHFMLPLSKIDTEKAERKPLMFGDTGIPLFFKEAFRLGANRDDLRIIIAGGANVIETHNKFDIGSRNVTIARKLFWKNNLLISAEDVGGNIPRTLYLEIGSGKTWFSSRGREVLL